MAKNTTVASKIRRLLGEDDVKNGCSASAIQDIMDVLAAREEKKRIRRRRKRRKMRARSHDSV